MLTPEVLVSTHNKACVAPNAVSSLFGTIVRTFCSNLLGLRVGHPSRKSVQKMMYFPGTLSSLPVGDSDGGVFSLFYRILHVNWQTRLRSVYHRRCLSLDSAQLVEPNSCQYLLNVTRIQKKRTGSPQVRIYELYNPSKCQWAGFPSVV
jgi:hypothetical protein